MLDDLYFVRGAVSKKEILPALTHFKISNGRITGYNGKMCLSSPIAVDLECSPRAEPLVRAVAACNDVVQLNLTPTGRLAIKSGKFRSYIECFGEQFPEVEPEGDVIQLDGKLLPMLDKLYPIMSDDATRPWASAVRLAGKSAFVTNNILLVQYWLGFEVPFAINIPRFAVAEMLRIKAEPIKIHVSPTSVTFEYENERWLRTQLVAAEWPAAEELLDRLPTPTEPLSEKFYYAVRKIEPFVNKLEQVFFTEGAITTALEEGTSYDYSGLPAKGIYSSSMLLLLEGIAETIDFTQYPKPCPFLGKDVRGAIIGMRPTNVVMK